MKLLLPILLFAFHDSFAQNTIYKNFDEDIWSVKRDSLKAFNDFKVSETNDLTELASNIALTYYPELVGNKIKIKYKKKREISSYSELVIQQFFQV